MAYQQWQNPYYKLATFHSDAIESTGSFILSELRTSGIFPPYAEIQLKAATRLASNWDNSSGTLSQAYYSVGCGLNRNRSTKDDIFPKFDGNAAVAYNSIFNPDFSDYESINLSYDEVDNFILSVSLSHKQIVLLQALSAIGRDSFLYWFAQANNTTSTWNQIIDLTTEGAALPRSPAFWNRLKQIAIADLATAAGEAGMELWNTGGCTPHGIIGGAIGGSIIEIIIIISK